MPFTPADPTFRPDSLVTFPDGREPAVSTGLFFTPPTYKGRSMTLPDDTTSVSYRLFRYFDPTDKGINVFKLKGGKFTEDQPYPYDTIDIWYLGGHTYPVTEAEAADLRAAGYTVEGFTDETNPTGSTWGDLAGKQWGSFSGTTWGSFLA